jgi:hypothetical protein
MGINIKQFGPQELDVLSKEIESALDAIRAKYGLSQLNFGGIRYNRTSFTAKISGKTENSESENYKKIEAEFFAMRNGLPPDLMGSEFLLDGAVFKITELVTSRPKYPITAYCHDDGRTFKFTVQRIKELLETCKVINIPYKDEETN